MLVVIENPSTGALKDMPWFEPLRPYLKKVDYCAYAQADGTPFPTKKPTALWSNVAFTPKLCPHKRHGSSLIGDKSTGGSQYYKNGVTMQLWQRHSVPTELQLDVLRAARLAKPRGKWVLDCFSGGQSLKLAAERLGLLYVGADVKPKVYVGRQGGERAYVATDLCEDIREADLPDLVRRAAERVGLPPSALLLVWCSPPCTTYSQIQTLNPPERRHRDFANGKVARTPQAHADDRLTAHWAAQALRAMADTVGDDDDDDDADDDGWRGPVISLSPALANAIVERAIRGVRGRHRLAPPTWVAVYASKERNEDDAASDLGDDASDLGDDALPPGALPPGVLPSGALSTGGLGEGALPSGAVVGFVHVTRVVEGVWHLDGRVRLEEPVRVDPPNGRANPRCLMPIPAALQSLGAWQVDRPMQFCLPCSKRV